MCGIVGLYGNDNNFSTSLKREYILQGLHIDALRGQESTGFALLHKKGQPEVYKRAVSGPDFVQLKNVLRLSGKLADSYGIIGHNRSSTRGTVIDENAHPFQYKHITLVHNGTVNNSAHLLNIKCAADSDVDSAQVAWAFSVVEPDDILPNMTGPFSLVWWDSRDGTLHFARNDQKPMYWTIAKDKRTMYYASELEMIQLLVRRNNIATTGEYLYTAPGKHYIFKNPDKVEEYDARPFVKPPQKKKGGHQWNQLPAPIQGSSVPAKSEILPTKSSNGSGTGTGGPATIKYNGDVDLIKKHPVADEKISSSMVVAISNALHMPNRVSETKARCTKDGIAFRKVIVAQPRLWKPYNDTQAKGTMLTTYWSKSAGKILVLQVLNCSMGNWVDKTRLGQVPVQITGYREAFSRDQNVYIGEIDEKVFDIMVERANGKKESIDTVEIGMVRTQHVTIAEFNELVSKGCCNCGMKEDMNVNNAARIAWVGPDEKEPVCPACSDNPQIMTAMQHEVASSAPTKH